MKSRPIKARRFLPLTLACLLIAAGPLRADAKRLVILHTNDLHDHVRAGYNGDGGLPYVSGYVEQVRAEEPAVLVLDAGDVAEKGDIVAYETHSMLTYELLGRIGYDGIAIGNHDFDPFLAKGIRRFEKVLGQSLLCLNIEEADGVPEFTPSRIVSVGGLKVGLIGLIAPRGAEFGGLDFVESGRALDWAARRLRPLVDLLVAICHDGVSECADWSRAAPDVQLFISGHSHVPLSKPKVVPETGALIVQAGYNARWVGRLELEVDAAADDIVSYDGWLVPMDADTVPIDSAMADWVKQREQAICPEATEIVAHNAAPVSRLLTGWLCVDALWRAAGTDLAFCHPGNIIRNPLPAGDVDVNALFVAGGQRGNETVQVDLTGAQVEAYLEALGRDEEEWNQTVWAGMRVTRGGPDASGPLATPLQPERSYSVIMPELEWRTRFSKMARKVREHDPESALAQPLPQPEPSPVQLTEALRVRAKALTAEGRSLEVEAKSLARSATDTPDDSSWWWTVSESELVRGH